MRKIVFANLFLFALIGSAFAQSAAEMCRNMKESYQCCMDAPTRKMYMPYIRKMCSGGTTAHRYANETNALREEAQRQQAEAATSFILGVVEGAIANYQPRGRSATPVPHYSTNRRVAGRTYSPAVRASSRPVTTTSIRANTTTQTSNTGSVRLNGSQSGVIGSIKQPNGTQDAIFSTPCTPVQTGTTSYGCKH